MDIIKVAIMFLLVLEFLNLQTVIHDLMNSSNFTLSQDSHQDIKFKQ